MVACRRRTRPAAAALGAIAIASSAVAFDAGVSPVIFRAEANNFLGNAVIEISLDQGTWDSGFNTYVYERTEPLEIISESSNAVLATILDVYIFMRTAPVGEVKVDFTVLATDQPTAFYVDSPILDFVTIPQPESRGRASATISLVDVDCNVARVEAIGPAGSGCFEALVVPPSGAVTRFSSLLYFLQTNGCGTVTGTQNDPTTGYRPIGQTVDAIASHLAFTITPNDAASISTRFIVPPRTSVCDGDIDADNLVGLSDLSIMLVGFGADWNSPNYDFDADIDRDRLIGLADLTFVLSNFGSTCQ